MNLRHTQRTPKGVITRFEMGQQTLFRHPPSPHRAASNNYITFISTLKSRTVHNRPFQVVFRLRFKARP